MKKEIKLVLFFLVLGFVGGVLFYAFRKSPESVKNTKPDFAIEATALVDEFMENEIAANQKYLDKILQIEGIVAEIGPTQNEKALVYLEGNLMGNISCSFSNKELEKNPIKTGTTVIIKGKCTGYIMDVVLTKCAFVD